MKRVYNPILKIASEYESTVRREFFYEPTECGLCRLGIKIVCFIKNDYLLSAL
jgi:hypothetical protein